MSLKAIGKIKVKKKGQPDTVIEEPVEIVKSYWFDKSQSWERSHNNNVSSEEPKKALVSPRNGHPIHINP